MKQPSAKPTTIVPARPRDEIENYSPEQVAEYLLNNAVDAKDYAAACSEVRALGLDPDRILHVKPAGA